MSLTRDLRRTFAEGYDLLRRGELRTLVPFLPMFRVNGRPMTLRMHYQFAPLFATTQPTNTVVMCGRQQGKSNQMCASNQLRSMLIPFYHTMIVQPQMDQILRLMATVYRPLLSSCPIVGEFISPDEMRKTSLREFRNGSLCYAEHLKFSPDRTRGAGNIASVYFDESLRGDTLIATVAGGRLKFKKIRDVKQKDFILSLDNDGKSFMLSVADRNASYHGTRACFRVTTVTGRQVVCTADHEFLTDHGWMRLEEIIEHEHLERSHGNRNERGAGERHHGEPAGGRLPAEVLRQGEGAPLEPRREADGVPAVEVSRLVRVRTARTVHGAESGLREHLGHIGAAEPWHTALAAHPSLSEWCAAEDGDDGLPLGDNAPHRPGLVVHGRRDETGRIQHWEDMHQRLLPGGERAAGGLASVPLGRCLQRPEGEADERERGVAPHPAGGGLHQPDAADSPVRAGVHGLQDHPGDADLRALRHGDAPAGPQRLLLGGVPRGGAEGTEAGVLPGAQAGAEESPSGAGAGRASCPPQGAASGAHAGPGVQGAGRQVAQGVLRPDDDGRGAPPACAGEAPGAHAHGRGAGEEPGVPSPQTRPAPCGEPGGTGGARRADGPSGGGRGDDSGGEGRGPRRQGQGSPCREGRGDDPGGARGGSSGHERLHAGAVPRHEGEGGDRARQGGVQTSPGEPDGRGAAHGVGAEAALPLSFGAGDVPGRDAKGASGGAGGEVGDDPCGAQGGGLQGAGGLACLRPWGAAEPVLDPIARVEYVGEEDVYDVEVVGTHSYVLANGICSHNCQDIEYEFLDVVNETMSASLFWGFSVYLGTPKTTDTTLALLWNRSSQAEWVIRCTHCGRYNIPNPEQDLLKMIGDHGPVCAGCGKPVSPRDGGYVHAIPDRALSFPGYHLSQTVHPLHVSYENKWRRLLAKVKDYDTMTLYNEVFGWPYDASTSPLTMADLQRAVHDLPEVDEPSDAANIRDEYRYVTVGVDWSGGGAISDSYTALAVLGLRADSDVVDVIHGARLPKGMSPTDEAREVLRWIRGVDADAFAYDNGGAGFVRLEIMKHEGLMSVPGLTVVPINYTGPSAGDVMRPHTGVRESDLYYYTMDKSRSLSVIVNAIKACRIRLPEFPPEDANAVQRDLLALRDDPRRSRSNDVVIVIIKKPGVPDDFAHAVNFGCSQIWDHFGAYPRIGTRYDTSLLEPTDGDDARDLRQSGPRGDFDRFMDAVDMRAQMVEEPGSYEW